MTTDEVSDKLARITDRIIDARERERRATVRPSTRPTGDMNELLRRRRAHSMPMTLRLDDEHLTKRINDGLRAAAGRTVDGDDPDEAA